MGNEVNNVDQHDAAAKEQIDAAFNFRNREAAVLINDVNYWTFGELEKDIPEKYYSDDPQVSMEYQVRKIKRHYEYFPDDCYIGFLHPWFGTGVLASGFGTPIVFNYKSDPAVDLSKIETVDELKSLKLPNPGIDGIMPNVVRAIEHYRKNSNLPVGVTDCQGPLTTALSVIGYDKYCYWMYDYPKEIHELMELVTEGLIQWVRYQKELSGVPMDSESYPLGVRLADGFGGAWMSDDDAVIMPTDLYREFVMPYNSKFLKAFGGGCIHYCGSATQHIESYCDTDGLTAIHNLNLDTLGEAKKMREALVAKGIVYIACDFIPSESRITSYYSEMLDAMGSPEGLIVAPYVAPAIELDKGKYEASERDQLPLARRVDDLLRSEVNNRKVPAGA